MVCAWCAHGVRIHGWYAQVHHMDIETLRQPKFDLEGRWACTVEMHTMRWLNGRGSSLIMHLEKKKKPLLVTRTSHLVGGRAPSSRPRGPRSPRSPAAGAPRGPLSQGTGRGPLAPRVVGSWRLPSEMNRRPWPDRLRRAGVTPGHCVTACAALPSGLSTRN